MDRTSIIVIVVCLVALFGLEAYLDRVYPTPPPRPVASVATNTAVATSPAGGVSGPEANAPSLTPAAPAAAPTATVPAQLTVLENDDIRVTFTSQAAAISEVLLKKHAVGKDGNVILNEKAHSNIMALSGWPGADTASFQVQQNGATGVTYSTDLPGGVKWQRTYTLGDGYALDVRDSLANTTAAAVTLPAYSVSVGRAEPLRVAGHYQNTSNLYLGSGWLTAKHFHITTVGNFNSSTFLWVFKSHDARLDLGSREIDDLPLRWLGVENQFFTVLLTPKGDRTIPSANFHCYNERDPEGNVPYNVEPDIEATALFPEVAVPAGQTVALDYSLYAGPKEYDRLNALGDEQGELMNYNGFLPFAYLIVPMLGLLHFFHSFLHNYGVAIILLTLCIKGLTWPLQSFTNRSGKRMQALAPKIKELQAKYKEQPEKLNSETFGLYREYGVNPFAGCLPALVQMPVFFSLYYMLQNAVELRGQSFLWVHDLTQPDTIASLTLPFALPLFGAHLVLNPLPIMVTGLTMVMMRMTPQMGDPAQAKVAQFMPLIFLVFLYNFASALSLYYVINNCVSIIQIYRNLRKPMPELKRIPRK
jgi:YidC/Oxa1 family membrane protein insertase